MFLASTRLILGLRAVGSTRGFYKIPLLNPKNRSLDSIAIVSENGKSFSYKTLFADSEGLARRLLALFKCSDLEGRRVSFLSAPTYSYVVMQWAIWRSGGVAVPLSPHHTLTELTYFLQVKPISNVKTHSQDSQSSAVIVQSSLQSMIPQESETPSVILEMVLDDHLGDLKAEIPSEAPLSLPRVSVDRDAMIIYTSGTTGKPKVWVLCCP
jgi:malonyl-CoA/methylmalonyl-CoA synthetase